MYVLAWTPMMLLTSSCWALRRVDLCMCRYHMQEHRERHNPHISQVVPKDTGSKVRYYDNKVVSHDGKRWVSQEDRRLRPAACFRCVCVSFRSGLIFLVLFVCPKLASAASASACFVSARYMTLPPKSGHDATREDRMATSVSLAWVKVSTRTARRPI